MTTEHTSLLSFETYTKMYDHSLTDPDAFWAEHGKRLTWSKPYTKVKNTNFNPGNISIRWFEDGELNACYNCVDRHLPTRAQQTAIIFEGDEPGESQHITYEKLHEKVCKCANALKSLGVKKGDRVVVYLPMRVEAAVIMLACARIGAIHCVVFGGFSAESLASRIVDCQPKLLITVDQSQRGGKNVPFKSIVDKALTYPGTSCIEKVLVIQCGDTSGSFYFPDRDIHYNEMVDAQNRDCPVEPMNAEDPLFILYTSGSTGKPKGLVHTTGGYLVYAAMTHEYVFDLQEGDVHWCTADIGWITGHSYVVYGPLANGSTTLIFEGVPNYPTFHRFWEIIDRHKVTLFYTAPTVIRTLKGQGDSFLSTTRRESLRVLGTVGEPIDPTAWKWYFEKVGHRKCYVADTYWQTETGGHIITPIARMQTPTKPGSATFPFFGIRPILVDHNGHEIEGSGSGNLCIVDSWPGQARSIYNAHDAFEFLYFKHFKGLYFTGDGASRDDEGCYWITGRVDDVINVSGHRLGTNELESAIAKHGRISEAAVVGFPHDIKGQGIYAYVVTCTTRDATDDLKKELIGHVREIIGPIATIDKIQWVDALPKTRSGKVMRRILRKIAEGSIGSDLSQFGDTSTLADPKLIERLIEGKQ